VWIKPYDLIYYFRLGLLYEQQQFNTKKAYPLRGAKKPYGGFADKQSTMTWGRLRFAIAKLPYESNSWRTSHVTRTNY
jgi:hypothetical protein